MKHQHVWIVLRKEVLDCLRDRSSLVTTLMPAIFAPIVFLVIGSMMLSSGAAAAPAKGAGGLVLFLPMLLMWMALTGGLPVALDSTVGERERSSLEPLLLTPVSRGALATGKWLAASLFGCAGVALSALMTLLALKGFAAAGGGPPTTAHMSMGMLILAMVPIALLMSAGTILISTLARSFKQAQSFTGFLTLGTAVVSLVCLTQADSGNGWISFVPVTGQLQWVSRYLMGQTPSLTTQLLSGLGTILLALALVGVSSRLLWNESTVFKR